MFPVVASLLHLAVFDSRGQDLLRAASKWDQVPGAKRLTLCSCCSTDAPAHLRFQQSRPQSGGCQNRAIKMNKSRLLCAAAVILLAACGKDGLAPDPVAVQFRVVSATASASATPSAEARGEAGQVLVTGTYVGECSADLEAVARKYDNGLLVLDLVTKPGSRTCEAGAGNYAFQYDAVLSGLEQGQYLLEVQDNSRTSTVPAQSITVR